MINFTFTLLDQVWEKAVLIPGMDPTLYRRDEQGSVIRKSDFNNEGSIYGWCFHHDQPLWEGGQNEVYNVTPLSCTNQLMSLSGLVNKWKRDIDTWD